jgi:CheY-like chemotaxis protein
VVDDDPTVLLILRGTLERMTNSPQIVVARDGTEALAKVQNGSFDLVITDVRMPGIDGIQLVKAIRALKVDTAVIWITAYGCHGLHAAGERLGVYRCLDKPFSISQIRQATLEVLETIQHPMATDE